MCLALEINFTFASVITSQSYFTSTSTGFLIQSREGAMSGGNPIGANQQLSEAHQMMAEAGMLKGTAGSLDGQVQAMNGQIPAYLAAAHWAAWRKMSPLSVFGNIKNMLQF